MDIQNSIVGTIILLALLYVGSNIWRKVKSFSGKSSCGSNCGCGSKSSPKDSFEQIRKS
ncbi:MAG: FeoB-associated Cys-rich membrane protein [Acidobacteriota bacterium]|nr:FeoB-associated Cys-rich membrane protein [Acidobacteriota bacterium]